MEVELSPKIDDSHQLMIEHVDRSSCGGIDRVAGVDDYEGSTTLPSSCCVPKKRPPRE